jgi:hypothetical protein
VTWHHPSETTTWHLVGLEATRPSAYASEPTVGADDGPLGGCNQQRWLVRRTSMPVGAHGRG